LSQYYPQPSPYYPPEQYPEEDYYEEGEYEYEEDEYSGPGDSLVQRILLFCAGGFLIFICMGCCGLLGIGLWILDPGGGLVTTPVPGSDIGLSPNDPAFPDESVVNEQELQLTIIAVNRNAALQNVPTTEGKELIIVTIELTNLSDAEVDFNERDFALLNSFDETYVPIPGAVEGALGRGTLPDRTGLEGRLVFEVVAGEFDLILVWEGGADSEPRYIWLE
jgi:hypothetical protein